MANVADGATGTILTAPSPATSGTSVVLNAGEGYRFPAVPFFAVAHANNTIPTVSTSEKVQVTAQGQTTIAVASNGASLPQATINVVDTTSLLSAGTVTITTSAGPQVVTYTGKTGTTLTGASGGTGSMSTGNAVMGDNFTIVRAISPYSAQSIAVTWRFSNAIFASDLNNASIVRNEVPVGSINGSNTAFTTASQYMTRSLEVYKNGVRMKGGGADYTETAGGFTMVTAPATGTVLLVDYFVGGTINNIGTNSIITDETPTGSVNGSNTAFATARPYIASSLEIYINGLKQVRGTDYTETTPGSGSFTMTTAPLTGDLIRTNYQYNLNPASNADTVDGYHANSTPTAGVLLPLNSRAQSGEWYEELGRSILTSAGDLITVTFTAKKYLRFIINTTNTGAINHLIRFNNDSGTNYAYRFEINGGADSTAASAAGLSWAAGDTGITLGLVMDVTNASALEKLVTGMEIGSTPGAANIPFRVAGIGKWSNTSSQINRIDLVNTNSGDYAIGSEIIVLGHD